MTTFISRFDTGHGLRVAVKDLIDMAGVATTAGSKAVASMALPAERDAACLAGTRAAEAEGAVRIVGKTNLHEIGFGLTGINPWFGTPTNPLDPTLVPGGSSSGSAVAVADDAADIAFGTDTGGSIRIPAACCGVVGLKTTYGRVALDGVRPLAPSLDTVGPMARDIAGTVAGMALLEPGFTAAPVVPLVVGRMHVATNPRIESAIDGLLSDAELEVVPLELPGWSAAHTAADQLLMAEAWETNGHLVEDDAGGVGGDVADRLQRGATITAGQVSWARSIQGRWRAELRAVFRRVQVIVLSTLADLPPTLGDGPQLFHLRRTLPFNLAGLPSLSMPVAMGRGLPASLQLVGPERSEDRLLALGRRLELVGRASRPT